MAEFTWLPSRGFTTDITPRVTIAKFGDGYSQRVPDGINNLDQSWNLAFQSHDLTTISEIESFIVTRQGANSFTWLPPGESTEVRVICNKWSKVYDSHISATLNLTFERFYGNV
jgi:phage-related protein